MIGVFEAIDEAFSTGMDEFGADQFSIEEIGAQPIHLGVFGFVSFHLTDA